MIMIKRRNVTLPKCHGKKQQVDIKAVKLMFV